MKWLDSGDLLVEDADQNDPDKRVIFRQVGWQGQKGRFYTMDELPTQFELGGFSPIYKQISPE